MSRKCITANLAALLLLTACCRLQDNAVSAFDSCVGSLTAVVPGTAKRNVIACSIVYEADEGTGELLQAVLVGEQKSQGFTKFGDSFPGDVKIGLARRILRLGKPRPTDSVSLNGDRFVVVLELSEEARVVVAKQ